jgi:hypothetical protein
MSVTNPIYQASYAGRGDLGPYAITFDVTLDDGGNANDINVQVKDSLGTLTDITATSTVTGMNVYTALVYGATYTVIVSRYPDLTQPYTFPYGTKFPSRTFENALDRQCFLLQRLYGDADLALKAPIAESPPSRIPSIADRANKLLGFDGSGDPMAADGSSSAVSAAMAPVVSAATLADSKTAYGISTIWPYSFKIVSSGNYTILDDDGYTHVDVTTGAADRTITLPDRASNPTRHIFIRKADSAAYKVIVARAGSDTINGTTLWEITSQYGYVDLVDNGTEWIVVSAKGSEYLLTDSSDRTQASPSTSTWYNLGSLSLTLPPGRYVIGYEVLAFVSDNSTGANIYITLSKANNTQDDINLTSRLNASAGGATSFGLMSLETKHKTVTITSSTTYYLNAMTQPSGVDTIGFYGASASTIIHAERIG